MINSENLYMSFHKYNGVLNNINISRVLKRNSFIKLLIIKTL